MLFHFNDNSYRFLFIVIVRIRKFMKKNKSLLESLALQLIQERTWNAMFDEQSWYKQRYTGFAGIHLIYLGNNYIIKYYGLV